MAGLTIADIGLMDLYSCFPGARGRDTRSTCRQPRGGRPALHRHRRPAVFRRAGNNYVMHSIVTMLGRCAKRGALRPRHRQRHVCDGLRLRHLSTIPTKGAWKRRTRTTRNRSTPCRAPRWRSKGEQRGDHRTYGGPRPATARCSGIVIGKSRRRQPPSPTRPRATSPAMQTLMDTKASAARGRVHHENGKNVFVAA